MQGGEAVPLKGENVRGEHTTRVRGVQRQIQVSVTMETGFCQGGGWGTKSRQERTNKIGGGGGQYSEEHLVGGVVSWLGSLDLPLVSNSFSRRGCSKRTRRVLWFALALAFVTVCHAKCTSRVPVQPSSGSTSTSLLETVSTLGDARSFLTSASKLTSKPNDVSTKTTARHPM